MSKKCINCNKVVHQVKGKKKVISDNKEARLYSQYLKINISINDILCGKCRLLIYRKKASTSTASLSDVLGNSDHSDSASSDDEMLSSDQDSDLSVSTSDVNYIELPFRRVVSTHRYCIICRSTTNLHRIPFATRCDVFLKKNIFIPLGARCCSCHMIGNHFYEDELSLLRPVSNTSKVSEKEIVSFLNLLSRQSTLSLFDRITESSMPEVQLKALTGFTWASIKELLSLLTSMRNTSNRTILQALVIFLFKLRTGNSNRIIANIFELKYEQQVSDFFNDVMKSFEKDILPNCFGYNCISREQIISNTTHTARKLLGAGENQLILIFDGTYLRHQKSSNNYYQKQSYSGQKKVHLCKPFTICSTNGYIVDIAGPFYGNVNDATIMKQILEDPIGIKSLLQANDLFIVDRGFRDAVDHITNKGYIALMPAFKGRRDQLSTEEANLSRKITKLRWVVEAVHGMIAQKYRLLHHSLDNKMLPQVNVLCKIVGFLHNRYGKRLSSDGELTEIIIEYMESKMNVVNSLAEEVKEQRWNRRKSNLQNLNTLKLLDFPHLSERELKILFTGSYQFSQAVSYLAEIMDDQGNLYVQYVKQTPNIIKAEVKSRHINRKVYHMYIDYVPNGIGHQSIQRYCCDCPNGNRTVGCCSHVAAIIYYLSFARYLSRIIRPAEILSSIFTTDKIPVVINQDSDDD